MPFNRFLKQIARQPTNQLSATTITADIDLNPDDLAQAAKQSDEMGLAELGDISEKVEREGYGAIRYRVDYHSKIAAPFVCLFLSVLGAGIALRDKSARGDAGEHYLWIGNRLSSIGFSTAFAFHWVMRK
jgi:lipopolysaccharide export LptBFGC system permease protein LptF